MARIELTKGQHTIVDDEDFEFLNQWKWYAQITGKHWVAIRSEYVKIPGGGRKRSPVYMHRLINKTPEGFQTDHIDRNPLNNTKKNLRTVTSSENNRNRTAPNKNGLKGIHWSKKDQRWRARIQVNGVRKELGGYLTQAEAASAYENAVLKLHGDYACTVLSERPC